MIRSRAIWASFSPSSSPNARMGITPRIFRHTLAGLASHPAAASEPRKEATAMGSPSRRASSKGRGEKGSSSSAVLIRPSG